MQNSYILFKDSIISMHFHQIYYCVLIKSYFFEEVTA